MKHIKLFEEFLNEAAIVLRTDVTHLTPIDAKELKEYITAKTSERGHPPMIIRVDDNTTGYKTLMAVINSVRDPHVKAIIDLSTADKETLDPKNDVFRIQSAGADETYVFDASEKITPEAENGWFKLVFANSPIIRKSILILDKEAQKSDYSFSPTITNHCSMYEWKS